jgi:hypothetical protein
MGNGKKWKKGAHETQIFDLQFQIKNTCVHKNWFFHNNLNWKKIEAE